MQAQYAAGGQGQTMYNMYASSAPSALPSIYAQAPPPGMPTGVGPCGLKVVPLQLLCAAAVSQWVMLALAGLGQPTGVLPAAQQPKKAVPEWLRAEMLSRGISLNAAGGAHNAPHAHLASLRLDWLNGRCTACSLLLGMLV